MVQVQDGADLLGFIRQHPGLATLATSTIAGPLLGLWTHNGAPLPGYGRLLTEAEAHAPPGYDSSKYLPSPNMPPIDIFGHPNTTMYSPAPLAIASAHSVSVDAPSNQTLDVASNFTNPDYTLKTFSNVEWLVGAVGVAAFIAMVITGKKAYEKKCKKPMHHDGMVLFLDSKVKTLGRANLALKKELDNVTTDKDKVISKLKKALENITNQKKIAAGDNLRLKQENMQYRRDLDTSKGELQSVKFDLEEYQERHEPCQEKLDRAEELQQEAEKKYKARVFRHRQSAQELRDAETMVAEKTKEISVKQLALEELQDEHRTLKEQHEAIKEQLEETYDIINERTRHLHCDDAAIREQNRELTHLKKALRKLQEQLTSLTKRNQDATTENDGLSADLARERNVSSEKDGTISDLRDKEKKLQQACDDVADKHKVTKAEHETMRALLTTQSKDLDEARNNVKEKETQISNYQAWKQQTQVDFNNEARNHTATSNRLETLKTQHDLLWKGLDDARKAVEGKEAYIAGLRTKEAQLQEAEAKITNLETSFEESKVTASDLQDREQSLGDKVSELETTISELKEAQVAAQVEDDAAITVKVKDVEEAQHKRTKKIAENTSKADAELATLRQQHKKDTADLLAFQQDARHKDKDVEQLKSESAILQTKLAVAEAEVLNKQNLISGLNNGAITLRRRVNDAEEMVQKKTTELAQIKQELAQVQQEKEDEMEANANLQDDFDINITRMKGLQKKLDDEAEQSKRTSAAQQKEIEELKSKLEHAATQSEHTQPAQVAELEQALEEANETNEAAITELQDKLKKSQTDVAKGQKQHEAFSAKKAQELASYSEATVVERQKVQELTNSLEAKSKALKDVNEELAALKVTHDTCVKDTDTSSCYDDDAARAKPYSELGWSNRSKRHDFQWMIRKAIADRGYIAPKKLVQLKLPHADPYYSDLPKSFPGPCDKFAPGARACDKCGETYTQVVFQDHGPACMVLFGGANHAARCDGCNGIFHLNEAFKDHEKYCTKHETSGAAPQVLNKLPLIPEYGILSGRDVKMPSKPSPQYIMSQKAIALGNKSKDNLYRALPPYKDPDYEKCAIPRPNEPDTIISSNHRRERDWEGRRQCFHCNEWYLVQDFEAHRDVCKPFFDGNGADINSLHVRCPHCNDIYTLNGGYYTHKDICAKSPTAAKCEFCDDIFKFADDTLVKHKKFCYGNPNRGAVSAEEMKAAFATSKTTSASTQTLDLDTAPSATHQVQRQAAPRIATNGYQQPPPLPPAYRAPSPLPPSSTGLLATAQSFSPSTTGLAPPISRSRMPQAFQASSSPLGSSATPPSPSTSTPNAKISPAHSQSQLIDTPPMRTCSQHGTLQVSSPLRPQAPPSPSPSQLARR